MYSDALNTRAIERIQRVEVRVGHEGSAPDIAVDAIGVIHIAFAGLVDEVEPVVLFDRSGSRGRG